MKKIYSIIISTLFIFSVVAQETAKEFDLNQEVQVGTNHHIARDKIVLSDGFEANFSTGRNFKGEINTLMLFEPDNAVEIGGSDGTPIEEQGLVGSIPCNFAVSPSGAATYTVPIGCPEGINGLTPQISLIYNSQSGNNVCGWKWNISGLSVITRTPKTIPFDGEFEDISWNNSDVYSLNGVRLVKEDPNDLDSEQYFRLCNDPKTRIKACGVSAEGP